MALIAPALCQSSSLWKHDCSTRALMHRQERNAQMHTRKWHVPPKHIPGPHKKNQLDYKEEEEQEFPYLPIACRKVLEWSCRALQSGWVGALCQQCQVWLHHRGVPEHLHPFRRLGKSRDRANSIPLRKECRLGTGQKLCIFILCRAAFAKLCPSPPWVKPHLRYLQYMENTNLILLESFFFLLLFLPPAAWLGVFAGWLFSQQVIQFIDSQQPGLRYLQFQAVGKVPQGAHTILHCLNQTRETHVTSSSSHRHQPKQVSRGEKALGAQVLNSNAGPWAVLWLLLWENAISLKSDSICKSGLCYSGLFLTILKMKSSRAYYCFIKKQILQHCWKQEVTLCYTAELGCASVTWGWERCQRSWGHRRAQLSCAKPRDQTQLSTKASVHETCTHLAVIIWGVHTGVDHVEQRINQSFTGPHLLPCLFPSRAQVSERWNDKGTQCMQGYTDTHLLGSLQKVFMQLISNWLATLSD